MRRKLTPDITPSNEQEPMFHVDTTSPLVVALPTNPCSLLALYTNIVMLDVLNDELERDIYGIP